ncbi:hypothetical protein [Helicobacter enhydrae]|nr:hypothetical protein [Helicobacter enhydrae]
MTTTELADKAKRLKNFCVVLGMLDLQAKCSTSLSQSKLHI